MVPPPPPTHPDIRLDIYQQGVSHPKESELSHPASGSIKRPSCRHNHRILSEATVTTRKKASFQLPDQAG